MLRPKIFLFNGPPFAGKDTAANHLNGWVPSSKVVKFAGIIKKIATTAYCRGDRALFDSFDCGPLEGKNTPNPQFIDKSCREVQIGISEFFMKKFHNDEGVFGNILADEIKEHVRNGYQHFFVSDSGFLPEAERLIDNFGAESLYLFRLHMDGREFKGDSRGYINLDKYNVPSWDIDNIEGQPEVMLDRLDKIILDATKF